MAAKGSVIRWGRHYELGIEIVDRQHEELMELLNLLYKQWNSGEPHSEQAVTMDRLMRATRKHFRSEEQLMAKHTYDGLASHKAEHKAFAAQVSSFEKDFRKGRTSLDEALLRSLANWIRNHLVVSDKPMGEAIRASTLQY